jgi:hypothetical protein
MSVHASAERSALPLEWLGIKAGCREIELSCSAAPRARARVWVHAALPATCRCFRPRRHSPITIHPVDAATPELNPRLTRVAEN